jgi:hypothetical protein
MISIIPMRASSFLPRNIYSKEDIVVKIAAGIVLTALKNPNP